MSQPLMVLPWNLPKLDSVHTIAQQSTDPRSWKTRPATTPATLFSDSDMSTITLPQSVGQSRLCRPFSSNEMGTRLPSVRQLLMPHNLVTSSYPDYHSSHTLTQPCSFSMTTTLASPINISSPWRRPPGSNVITSHSEECEATKWRTQPAHPSSVDIVVATTSHSLLPSRQRLSQTTSLHDGSTSAPASRSLAHLNQAALPSPQSNSNAKSTSFEFVGRHRSESHSMNHHFQILACADSRPDSPNQSGWGTTKAGKPRKRLAQACLNCRQKKIRCHPNPNNSKCTQCERIDLDCSFERGCVVRETRPLIRADRGVDLDLLLQPRHYQ